MKITMKQKIISGSKFKIFSLCFLILLISASLISCDKEQLEDNDDLKSVSTTVQSEISEAEKDNVTKKREDVDKTTSSKSQVTTTEIAANAITEAKQNHNETKENTKKQETTSQLTTQNYHNGIELPEDIF